jgi:hypothetical protein
MVVPGPKKWPKAPAGTRKSLKPPMGAVALQAGSTHRIVALKLTSVPGSSTGAIDHDPGLADHCPCAGPRTLSRDGASRNLG